MKNDSMRGWMITGLAALAVIVIAIPLNVVREAAPVTAAEQLAEGGATFVGRDTCVVCHRPAFDAWFGSDHDRAMAVADEQTVLGDFDASEFNHKGITSRFYRREGRFFVFTEGPGGEMGEFEILYSFGHEPLQQYLVPLRGGRLQALSIAWDVERRRWFHLNPDQKIPADDWLHWTRNGQNWNGMCAECHSTNLLKGYRPEKETFTTTWSEIDVSCEACHGPASHHVHWAAIEPMARPEMGNYGLVIDTGEMSARQQVELCAPCHSRRSQLGDYNHTKVDLLDNLVPSLLIEGLYHADGQIQDEVYVWGSFVQSKMYRNNIGCSACHDIHSLNLKQPANGVCLQCHRADAYNAYEHHFHNTTYQGKPSGGARCVSCHMPGQPYMGIDYRADHSLRIPRPDLTLEIGVPNACSQDGCHGDKPVQWSADAYTRWYGKARKPHYGPILAAGRAGKPEARDDLVQLAQDPLRPAIVRATALSLLRHYPTPATTALMKRALGADEALVRHAAVESLVVADRRELVSLLAPLLFDEVRAVRMRAMVQLASVPPALFEPYQRKAFKDVRADYVAAMTYSLDFSAAGMNLGNLYTALGDPTAAERYYRMAIEIDDLFFPAKINLAVLLSQRGRGEEAEQLLRTVVESNPDAHQAAYYLGLQLVERKRPAEALPFLRRAAVGMAENSRVRYNTGLLLQQNGKGEEAEVELRAAESLEPGNLDYLYALADHYIKRHRYDDALAVTTRMIAAHPESPMGHQLKALIERKFAK